MEATARVQSREKKEEEKKKGMTRVREMGGGRITGQQQKRQK